MVCAKFIEVIQHLRNGRQSNLIQGMEGYLQFSESGTLYQYQHTPTKGVSLHWVISAL